MTKMGPEKKSWIIKKSMDNRSLENQGSTVHGVVCVLWHVHMKLLATVHYMYFRCCLAWNSPNKTRKLTSLLPIIIYSIFWLCKTSQKLLLFFFKILLLFFSIHFLLHVTRWENFALHFKGFWEDFAFFTWLLFLTTNT